LLSLEEDRPTATQPNEVFFLECQLDSEGVSEEAGTFKVDYARSPFDLTEGQSKMFILSALINESGGQPPQTDSHYFIVQRAAAGDIITEVRAVGHDHDFQVALLAVDDRVVGVHCLSLKNSNNSSVWKIRMEVQQI
jgi:hypothetical protein